MEQEIHKSIYVINCIWEFFIVVGKEATGDRRTIKFALDLVTVSLWFSGLRPGIIYDLLWRNCQWKHQLPGHTPLQFTCSYCRLKSHLIFELEFVIWMKLGWWVYKRSSSTSGESSWAHFSSFAQNDGEIPDHMNLMPASEASNHVRRASSANQGRWLHWYWFFY